MCHFDPPFLTLCSINSIWSGRSHWSKLASRIFSWYTSCRWVEWGNITRCKELCWNGSQLNCSHMTSKSESRLKSSILILRFPDSICWGLSVWIFHPWGIRECLEWVYRVWTCLWLYLNTHTQCFCLTPKTMQHGRDLVDIIHSPGTDDIPLTGKSRTKSQARRINVTHTDGPTDSGLGLKSYIPHPSHDSQSPQHQHKTHFFKSSLCLIHWVAHPLQWGDTLTCRCHSSIHIPQMSRQTATSADHVKVSGLGVSAVKLSGFPESWALPHTPVLVRVETRTHTHTLVLDLSGDNRWAAQ